MTRIRQRWLLLFIIPILLFPILFTTTVVNRPVWDETDYHLPTVRYFGLFRITSLAFPDNPLPRLLLSITYPYFLGLSDVFMSEQPALCFGLLSIFLYLKYLRNHKSLHFILGIVSAALAILTRQYFLFLPVAFALNEFIPSPRRNLPKALLFLIPILAIVPFVLIWRGLTPPAIRWIRT